MHTCPRRNELFNDGGSEKDQDAYREIELGGEKSSVCSYCGSLSPEEFMQGVEAGAEIDPTDKNYKAYIHKVGTTAKFYYQHLSDEQMRKFVVLYNDKTMKIGYPGRFYVMPFFMHKVVKDKEEPNG